MLSRRAFLISTAATALALSLPVAAQVRTLRWRPPVCVGRSCSVITDQGQRNLLGVIRYCEHHQALRDSGMTDNQVFDRIRGTTVSTSKARWQVKLELMRRGTVDKEYPGVPYRVRPDGSIEIETWGDPVLAAIATSVMMVA